MKKFFKSLGKKSDKSPKGPPPEGSPKLGATARPSASTSSLVGYDVKEKELGKLHKAAWLNDVSKVRQLAKKDPSCFDKENRTPLHLACARGHADVVEALLEWKAKTNIADNNSKSPLMKAVEGGHIDCVSQLLESRADVDAADRDGNTCLHMACNFNDTDIAKLLIRSIRNKEKLNVKNKEGLSPIHYTIITKNEELCRLLLREGADVNIEDASGRTCLMKACQDGSINLVKILLEFEADTSHKDTKGWTADDCAVIQGHHACSQLIADHLLRQNLANRTPASTPRSSLPPSLAATPRDKSLEIGAPAMDITGHDSDDETVSKGSEVGAKGGGGYDDSWGDDTDLSMAGDDKKAKVVGPKVNLAKFIPDSDEGDSSRASKMARVEEEGNEDEDDPQRSPLKKRDSSKSLQSNTSWEEDSSWSVQEPKRSSTRVSFKEDKNLSQIHNLSGPESEESFDGKPAKDKVAPSKTGSYVPTGMSGTPAVSTISADKQRAPGNKNAFLEELGISDPDDLSDADVSEISGADPKIPVVAASPKTDDDSDWDSTAMSDPMSTPRPGILKNWKKQSNVEEEDEDEEENKGDHPVGKQNSNDEVDPSSEWDSTTADPAIREDKPPPLPMSPVPEKNNIHEYDSDIEEGILPDHQPVSSKQLIAPQQSPHDNSNQESDWDSTTGIVTPRQTGGLGYKEFRPGAEDDELSDPADEDEGDGGQPLQPVRDQVLMAVTHIAGVNPATPTPRNTEKGQEGGTGEKQEEEDEEDSEWDSDTDLLPSENGPAPVPPAKLGPAQPVSHHSRSADSDSDQGTETISEWEIERKKQKESIKVGGSLIDFEDMTDLTLKGQENSKQLEMEQERKKEEEELHRKEEERRAEEKRLQEEDEMRERERKLKEEAEAEERRKEEEMRERERKLKEEAEAEEQRKEEERQREEEMREQERRREEEERQEQEQQEQLKREAEAALEEEEQERQREWERQEERRQEQLKREADAALEEERQAAADISSGGDSLPDVDVHGGQEEEEDFELSEKDIPLMVEKTEPGLVQGGAPSILMSEFDGSEEELKRVEAEVQQDNLLGQRASAQDNVFKSSSLTTNGQSSTAKAQVQPIVRQQAVYAPPLSLPPTKSTSQTLKQRLQVPPPSQMALQNRMEDFDDEDSYASDNGNPDSPWTNERPDVTSYYPNLLGSSGAPSYNFSQVLEDDALSYTSTEFETESVVGKSMENSPFARDMLLSLNMNDPTTLVKLQEHYRDQRRQLEQEKNHRHMLENKLKLLNTERTDFTKKVESLKEHKLSLEQNKLDLEATIRGLEYKITEEEEKRRNAEVLLEKTKDQLNRKEEKYTSSVEEKQKAELERRNMVMELRAINNRVKELEGEREELERQLDHERETRLLQEKINEEQNKLHEQLQNEKVKAVKQMMEKRSSSQTGDDQPDGTEIDGTLKAELFALQTELGRQRSRAKDENALIVAENEDLHAKVEELKTEIKLREDALNVATMQYSVQIGSMQTENNGLSSELEKERAVREKVEAELESQKNRLQSTIAEMEKALQARHDLERELQLSHEELRKETEKKDAEMDKLRETITELTEKLLSAEMKISSMEKELNMSNTSLLERTNQLKQINHNIDGLKTSLDSMDQNYKMEKDHNSKLLSKIETLQDKLTAAQHESLNLKQQLETTRQAAIQDASIDAQEKFNTIIANMKTDHEKSLGALQERNGSLQETVTRLKEEMRNTENRRSTLEMDMRHHSQEHNELIKKLSHAEASLELAQKLKEQQEMERTQLKVEVERLQQKYQAAHEKSVESQARVSELVERMERAEQSSLASSQQLLHTSANIQAFSKSKDEVEGNMQKLLIENTRLEAELKHEKQRAEILQLDLRDSEKVRGSLEALCSNLKSTNAHLEDKLGEETANRTVLQQEAEDSKGLWEQEVVSRSKLGLRIAQLDRQKQEAVGSVEEEKRKARRALEGKKLLENKLEAEREKSAQLQKEITSLKVHLKTAKKKMKDSSFSDCVVNLSTEFDKERTEMEEALTVARKQLNRLRRELEEESQLKERLFASNMALQAEVEKLRTISASLGKISRWKLRLDSHLGSAKSGDTSTGGGGGGGGSSQDLDLLRAELEAKYRFELNRKLEEVNRYLEDQARARDRLDMSRGENESRLSIDKKKLEDENMDLKLKYEKARAACETREMEVKRFRELYDSEMKWRMRLADQLERATSRAGDYKSKLVSEKQRSKFITSVNNLNLSAISNGLDASRLSSTVDDPLSNKLRAELDRSIAKHLEAAPHDDSIPVLRSPDKSAVLESSFAKSSAEYYDLLKRKYCI